MIQTSNLKLDPSADVLHYDVRGLDAIIAPKSVAVIGATEKAGSVGRTIVWNLLSSPFGGTVFPVNPKRANILGIKAYPNVGAVPDKVDLAVIVTPAPTHTSLPIKTGSIRARWSAMRRSRANECWLSLM